MKHTVLNYRAVIKKDDNNTYYAVVPSLPGCVTQGDTIEATKANLKEAVTGWIESRIDMGWEVPKPDISDQNIEVIESIDTRSISNYKKIRYA